MAKTCFGSRFAKSPGDAVGQTIVEYALVLAILSVGLGFLILEFGTAILSKAESSAASILG